MPVRKIVVALQNPGPQYETTRHNVGAMFLSEHLRHIGAPMPTAKKAFLADISQHDDVLYVFPTTFMNTSGDAVQKALHYYKIDPVEGLIVIHDDLDIPLGSHKVSRDKNHAGHNGVASISKRCNTKNYTRLRIGIDGRSEQEKRIPGRDYVLRNFHAAEHDILEALFSDLTPTLEELVRQ